MANVLIKTMLFLNETTEDIRHHRFISCLHELEDINKPLELVCYIEQ